ncbi:putative ribonuclease H-like domain-containing protein [Tanacetum coccineum]
MYIMTSHPRTRIPSRPCLGCNRLVSRAKVIENQSMAVPVITISSDASEESLTSVVSRVILFGTIPTEIPIVSDMLTDLPTVPELPAVSPFLGLDDSESESADESPERHVSLRLHDDMISLHMDSQSTQTIKLPILQPGEYDLWKMRMEQYLQCIDYTLWEIVENSNAPIVTKIIDGKETLSSTSVEEKAKKELLEQFMRLLCWMEQNLKLRTLSLDDLFKQPEGFGIRELRVLADSLTTVENLSDVMIYSFFLANQKILKNTEESWTSPTKKELGFDKYEVGVSLPHEWTLCKGVKAPGIKNNSDRGRHDGRAVEENYSIFLSVSQCGEQNEFSILTHSKKSKKEQVPEQFNRRPFHKITTANNSNFTNKVNTVKGTRVNTARPKAVLKCVKGTWELLVFNASHVWVWRPKHKVCSHVFQKSMVHQSFIRFDYIDEKEDQANGEKIMIYRLYKKLMVGFYCLFEVIRIRRESTRKDFKLTDESHVLLKVSWKDIMYSVDLKNVIPQGGSHLSLAKATPCEYTNIAGRNQSNGSASTKACDDTGKARMETLPGKDYILLPVWPADPLFSQDSKSSTDAEFKPSSDGKKKVDDDQEKDDNDNVVDENIVYGCADDPNMPELEDIVYSDDDEKCWLQRTKQEVKNYGIRLAYVHLNTSVVYQMDAECFSLCVRLKGVLCLSDHGFEDPDFPDRVYKVEKALYGLHQAPRAWDKGDILLVQVYVDDIIFGSTKKSLCTEFEKMMHKKFQMSSMGELTFFLGLQVKQKEDGIFISQDKYVTEILKKFGFTDVKTASTPMETQKPLLKDEDVEEVDVHLYRSMIGSLMYLTSSRPDIMFAVCACARYQVNLKVSHLHAVKRIFRYLKVQPKLGLWYPKDSPFDLVAYTDSDYAGASLNRKLMCAKPHIICTPENANKRTKTLKYG